MCIYTYVCVKFPIKKCVIKSERREVDAECRFFKHFY